MQRAGVPVNLHTSLQIDSVFTAMRVITNAITKMGNPRAFTWALDSQNEPYRQWLPEQPAILTNTWGGKFQYDGMTRTVMSLGMLMEAFWYTLAEDELGYPTALEVLNPTILEIKPDPDTPGQVIYFYGSGQDRIQLDSQRLTHIPFLAFAGGLRGLNGIEYAGVSYALALAAMEFGQRFFAQGASPGYILSTEQKLGNDETSRIAEKFFVEHSGLQASHLPLVVDSGINVQKVQSTPDEAQFLQTLDYARSCIGSWFGLPSHLLGGLADKGNVWGKDLALDTLVPTPEGWTTMGDVTVGDTILGDDGKPVNVSFTSPVFLGNPCFRVEFNDGTSIVAGEGHLWETTDYHGRTAVRNTRELYDTQKCHARQNSNHRIKVAECLDLPERDLPLHPYLLGLWLGDGDSAGGRIAIEDRDIPAMDEILKPLGRIKWAPYGVGCKKVRVYGMPLREMCVLNSKHIPAEYLRSSPDQRLALLQGLMDSDGYAVGQRPRCEFENADGALAAQVAELTRSLGLRPTVNEYRSTKYEVDYGPLYRVGFNPRDLRVFRLDRKQSSIGVALKASRARNRMITAVVPVDSVATRCIQVDNESHLFLAGEAMVPTHNTVAEQGMQLVDFTLSGYITRLCEAFGALLPAGIEVAMDERAVQRADPENMAKLFIAKRTAGLETQNEIRVSDLKRPPLPGGDDLNAPMTSNTSPAVGQLFADDLAEDEGEPAPEPEPEEGQ
jgi:hypothetical protein